MRGFLQRTVGGFVGSSSDRVVSFPRRKFRRSLRVLTITPELVRRRFGCGRARNAVATTLRRQTHSVQKLTSNHAQIHSTMAPISTRVHFAVLFANQFERGKYFSPRVYVSENLTRVHVRQTSADEKALLNSPPPHLV